jgi:hypothetical protein
MVRTTLTLDDDIAAKLRSEARRTGMSLRDLVNATLRRGLASPRPARGRKRFRVVTRDLGSLAPGLSLDNVAELLEAAEGPLHR